MSRTTVIELLARHWPPCNERAPSESMLGPYRDEIRRMLAVDSDEAATVVLERIRGSGFEGRITSCGTSWPRSYRSSHGQARPSRAASTGWKANRSSPSCTPIALIQARGIGSGNSTGSIRWLGIHACAAYIASTANWSLDSDHASTGSSIPSCSAIRVREHQ
jgi:hypothetical protein